MSQNRSKWVKIDRNESKQIDQNYQKCSQISHNESGRIKTDQNVPK